MTPARLRMVVPERVEQAHIVQLLRSIGGRAYVLGTTRRRGDHQGTMQTPGVSDVIAFLPLRRGERRRVLFVECKSAVGRLRPEQVEFQRLCLESVADHVVGTLDAVIAWLVINNYMRADQVSHYRQPAQSPLTRSVSS